MQGRFAPVVCGRGIGSLFQQQHRQIAIAVEEQEAEFAYHTMYAHLKSVERHAR